MALPRKPRVASEQRDVGRASERQHSPLASPSTLLAFLVATLWFAQPAQSFSVTLLDPSQIPSDIINGTGDGESGYTELVEPTSLPTSATLSASTDGSSAVTSYSLSSSGFMITFGHSIGPAFFAHGESLGRLNFSVDSNVSYALDGGYEVVDPDGRWVYFQVSLFDHTAHASLFDNIQESFATPHETFALGLEGGDSRNRVEGSLTGTLLPGRTYEFSWMVALYNYPEESTSPASATGSASLAFVPEPAPGLLLTASLLGLATWRGRVLPRVLRRSAP